MDKEFQKIALQTLFHFVRVRAAHQPHVNRHFLDTQYTIVIKTLHTFAIIFT